MARRRNINNGIDDIINRNNTNSTRNNSSSSIRDAEKLVKLKREELELEKQINKERASGAKAAEKQRAANEKILAKQKEYIEELKLENDIRKKNGDAYDKYLLHKKRENNLKSKLDEYEAYDREKIGLTSDQKAERKRLQKEYKKEKATVSGFEEKFNKDLHNPNASWKEKTASAKYAAGKQQEKSGIFGEAGDQLMSNLDSSLGNVFGKIFGESGPLSDMLMNLIPGGQVLSVLSTIADVANAIHDALDGAVDEAMRVFTEYTGKVDSRLQGLKGVNFNSLVNNFNSTLFGTRYLNATNYLRNIDTLTQKGIAYNLEQRALINTIGEKLVATFETTNESLLRLIRLQQSDVTYAQLGAESKLTQLLNSVFTDTSYLNSLYDSVSSTLLEASSTMSRDNAISFNYAVQKWLAALYSVGMSESAVSTIAQGLGYLSTGNVSSLTGNTALNTLLSMSASKAGLSYGELLTSGLTYSDVDELMKAMIYYLKDIAENTGNQVTRQAYTNIMGLSVSDLRSIQNITDKDIRNVSSSNVTYNSSMRQYRRQLDQLQKRTTVAERVDNMLDNVMFTFGSNVADNEFQYLMWKSTDVLQDIMSMFDGAESGTGVVGKAISILSGMINTSSVAGVLIETLGDALTSSALGKLSIFNWDWGAKRGNKLLDFGFNWDEYTSRGDSRNWFQRVGDSIVDGIIDTFDTVVENVFGVSASASISNSSVVSSASDKLATTLAQNANAITVSGSTIQSADSLGAVRTVADVYAQLFDNKQSVRVNISGLEAVAFESLVDAIKSSGVNGEEEENSLLETSKKTLRLLEDRLETSSTNTAQSMMGTLDDVRYNF